METVRDSRRVWGESDEAGDGTREMESRTNTTLGGPLSGGKERRAEWSAFTADDAVHTASGLSQARGAARGPGVCRAGAG